MVQGTDFLGFWMTPTGIKPWKKYVEPILAMAPPQTLQQLHGLLVWLISTELCGNAARVLWRLLLN
jgi:hypothetical protein